MLAEKLLKDQKVKKLTSYEKVKFFILTLSIDGTERVVSNYIFNTKLIFNGGKI
ncbi:hypothetical protein IRB23SM22_08220 [Alkalibacterium sp. s-m-22]